MAGVWPFAICCDGRSGACSAEIADAAEGPEVAEFTDCDLALERPATGSDLPVGHRFFVGFFLILQPALSDDAAPDPFGCTELLDTVEVDELVDAMEDAEFCLCKAFRDPFANILPTSSEFMVNPFCPALAELHPILGFGWKDKGGATAVIGSSQNEDDDGDCGGPAVADVFLLVVLGRPHESPTLTCCYEPSLAGLTVRIRSRYYYSTAKRPGIIREVSANGDRAVGARRSGCRVLS